MSAKPVARPRTHALEALFGKRRAVVGVIHARPLPGAPDYDGEPVEDLYAAALEDGRRYARGGVDGLIVENHGDIPFLKPDAIGPETAAVMAVMADRVRREIRLPVGINVLANGALTAIAVAKAAGAGFIRVNQWANAYVANEGIVEARQPPPPAIGRGCGPAASRSSPTSTSSTVPTRLSPTGAWPSLPATSSSSTPTW